MQRKQINEKTSSRIEDLTRTEFVRSIAFIYLLISALSFRLLLFLSWPQDIEGSHWEVEIYHCFLREFQIFTSLSALVAAICLQMQSPVFGKVTLRKKFVYHKLLRNSLALWFQTQDWRWAPTVSHSIKRNAKYAERSFLRGRGAGLKEEGGCCLVGVEQ